MSLRVISGLKKGHKLKGPDALDARPTEDRIKEAIFNIISPIEEDAIILDLFACTGSIGIEFLSRGANKVYFSEINKKNVQYLRENLIHTKFEKESIILEGDFRKNITLINENVDYVYIDPPYESGFYEIAFDIMSRFDFFKNSLFIVEEDKKRDLSKSFENLELVYEKKYGRKYIKFYREKL